MSVLHLTNAALIDLETGDVRDGISVVAENGRILDVGPGASVAGAEAIDAKGGFLLPGLSDAHVHVTAATASFPDLTRWSPYYAGARSAGILEAMLMRGFTTVRDAGGADFGLAQAVEEGHLNGPRILFCGQAISQTGGHGDMRSPGENFEACVCSPGLGRVVDGIPEVRRACRDEIRKGASQIKIMASGGISSPTDRITSSQFSMEELRAAVEEAENASLYVMAHAYMPESIRRAVECGVRSIEHGNLIDEATADYMQAEGAWLVPTMSTYEAIAKEGVEAGMPADMQVKVHDVIEAGKRNLAMAHGKGVRMAYGTDLLGDMQKYQMMEVSLRAAFMTPLEVLQSATLRAAELFRMEGAIGQIAPGAQADLLIYDANPLDDLTVLQDPDARLKLIVKDGKFFKNAL
jgi:imidazolonepropionase-like amidohydrolase